MCNTRKANSGLKNSEDKIRTRVLETSAFCEQGSAPAALAAPGHVLFRKEVIQPHLPIRLPCYDFTPVIAPALGPYGTSGVNDFRGVTGGVYKARERIHRSMLTCDY